MAFGFIKKIFSFGRKQVEEVPVEAEEQQAALPAPEAEAPATPAEEAALAPVEAPETLEAETAPADVEEIATAAPEMPVAEEIPAERPPLPEFLLRNEAEEQAATTEPEPSKAPAYEEPAPVEPEPVEIPAPAEPAPAIPTPEEPTPVEPEPAPVEPEPQPAEVPAPAEPTPAPAPVEPEPAVPTPEKPELVPTPIEPEPEPVEVPAPAEPEPETTPALPEEVPAQPDEPAPPPAPVEVPTPPAEPAPEPQPAPQEVPPQPVEPPPASTPIEVPSPAQPETAPAPEEIAARPDATEESVVEEPLSPVEPTPSGPSDHLPLKEGEDAEPTPLDEEELASPEAEILPPLRQPEPIETDPLRDEIAPEPAPLPTPPPAPGKVTVTKKVEQKAEAVAPAAPEPKLSWFQRLRQGLSRSSKELSGSIAGVFTKRKLDEETLEELEDVLIRADLGMETALRVTDTLAASRYGKDVSDAEVRAIMATEVEKVLKPVAMPLELDLSHKPHVILVVGVNGTGKTTTIGKLAAKLTDGGLSVMLAAGDTFRAAAIEQLKIWGERTKSPVIASKLGADAAGLAYDAFAQAKEAGSDVLIIDTAGRLQNKAELMAELEKIVRVLGKLDPEAPHTVLQTVDATTGQNALNQVEIFRNVAGVNGLVMTKLDGTARGGILVAIAAKHKLPVYFIGVGEQVDDLEPFSASDFAKAIAGVA